MSLGCKTKQQTEGAVFASYLLCAAGGLLLTVCRLLSATA